MAIEIKEKRGASPQVLVTMITLQEYLTNGYQQKLCFFGLHNGTKERKFKFIVHGRWPVYCCKKCIDEHSGFAPTLQLLEGLEKPCQAFYFVSLKTKAVAAPSAPAAEELKE